MASLCNPSKYLRHKGSSLGKRRSKQRKNRSRGNISNSLRRRGRGSQGLSRRQRLRRRGKCHRKQHNSHREHNIRLCRRNRLRRRSIKPLSPGSLGLSRHRPNKPRKSKKLHPRRKKPQRRLLGERQPPPWCWCSCSPSSLCLAEAEKV